MSTATPGTPGTRAPTARSSAWTRSPSTRRSPRDPRRAVSALLAVFDLVLIVLVAGGVTGRAREGLGLAFCLLVPGWSMVGLARIRDVILEISLAMATGLASLVVLAQFVITVRAWHLFGIQIVVCALCLASLLYQVARPDQAPRSSA